jgi:chemotaxis signal transduction protein
VDCGPKSYLTFSISNKNFAIEAAYVWGIVPVQELTPVPENRADAARDIVGFATVSGNTFPVLDVRRRLALSATLAGPQAKIVVVQTEDRVLRGFIADRVSDILTYRSRNLKDGKLYGNGRTRRLIDVARTLASAASPLVGTLDCESSPDHKPRH